MCAAIPTDRASAGSDLRPCPVESIRTRRASFAGTSTTSMPSVASLAVSTAPRPVAPSMAQTAWTPDDDVVAGSEVVGPAAGEAAQLPVAVAVDLDADHGEGLQSVVDRDGGPGRFVGIDRDDDLGGRGRSEGHGVLLAGPGMGGPARRADQLRVKKTSLEPLSPAVVAGAQAVRGPARRRQVFPERPRPQPRRSWLQTLISATNPTSWRPLCCRRLDKERCRS